MGVAGLDLAGLAELVEMSPREFVQLGQSDRRIVGAAALATPESRQVVRTWNALGRPVADLSRLVFCGHGDHVRDIVVRTIATLPMPIQWQASNSGKIAFASIGGTRAAGWMARIPSGVTQVIALDGSMPDDLLPSVLAHELAHAIHSCTEAASPRTHLPTAEAHALRLAAEALLAGDRDEKLRGTAIEERITDNVEACVRRMYHVEVLANDTGALWNYPSSVICPDAARLEWVRRDLLATRNRAAEILAEFEMPVAACETEGAQP